MTVGACIFTVMYISSAQKRIDLAVSGKNLAGLCDLPHRLAHYLFILHSGPVVGKTGDKRGESLM